jgi:hypothetical protein
MSVCMLADPIVIRKAFDLVGAELRDRRMLGEIMVCSGSVFLLRYGWTDDGTRIEVDISFDGRDGLIRQACERAGQAVRLLDGWLDRLLPRLCRDGVSTSGNFPTGMYPTWEKPGLRVLAASPDLLIPMVFLATLRPMPDMTLEDMEPAFRIAAAVGIRTSKRLRKLVMPYLERKSGRDVDFERMVEGRLSRFEEGLDRFGLSPSLRIKPKSLAEVIDLVRENPDWFNFAMYQFKEVFYLEKNPDTQQAMLDPAPVPLGIAKNDAWIGATGEHLSQRWGLKVPAWTQEAAFMGGSVPDFWSTEPTARDIEIVETPPAFRRRLLFSSAEPLMDAKFPNHRKVRMPYWQ